MLERIKNIGSSVGLGGRSGNLLGVDISSTAVKILQLSSAGGSCRVQNYVMRPLPANSVVEKNISDIDAVGECIAAAVSALKPPKLDAAVAVAGSAVITKTIEMDAALSDAEMEYQILVEADQYIPFPLDEVAIDFERQGLSKRNPERVEVLLAACRRENVESRVAALERGGLRPIVVDIEAHAVARAHRLMAGHSGMEAGSFDTEAQPFDKEAQPFDKEAGPSGMEAGHTVAIVDIGATMTTLNVIQQGESIHTREQRFGGNALSEAVQRRFGLTAVEAETAMRQGELPQGWEEEILVPFRATVVQQVSQTLQSFFSFSHHNKVDSILLAGGVATIAGLAQQVQDSLDTPAAVADPFTGLQTGVNIDTAMLANDAPSLLIAAGLAMRGSY